MGQNCAGESLLDRDSQHPENRVIRGILFDLDGVLIHSTPAHRAAFEQVFKTLGIEDFCYPEYAGWRTPEVIADVIRRHGIVASEDRISVLAKEKSRIARQMLDLSRPLDPNCGSVLAELAADYSLALASSGSRSSVDAFLKWSGTHGLFQSDLSGDDVERAKPDPECYSRSAENLDLRADECLVVEDSVSGIRAAHAIGAQSIGIAGTSSAEALRNAGASDVLDSLDELPTRLRQCNPLAISAIDPASWTAVIPAAGKGSRLGFHLPKILFPVAGRTILDWLLDNVVPHCARLVFVLSPDGSPDVKAALEDRIPGRYDIVLQHTPTGMGDAVALGLNAVRTTNVAVVWGDQVALQKRSVELSLRIHQGPIQPDATCPTVIRENPYIHFERGTSGRVTAVRQAREGDAMPQGGETDTGFFCFRTEVLRSQLAAMKADVSVRGKTTGEFNLLPVFPRIAEQGRLVTPRMMTIEETVGINSASDAASVESYLRRSRPQRTNGHN